MSIQTKQVILHHGLYYFILSEEVYFFTYQLSNLLGSGFWVEEAPQLVYAQIEKQTQIMLLAITAPITSKSYQILYSLHYK